MLFYFLFIRQTRKDVSDNNRALFKLRAAAQTAKHTLSTQQTAAVQIESLYEGMDFQCTVTRCVCVWVVHTNIWL